MITCDNNECTRPAVAVMRFRARGGHVHLCGIHEAHAREWYAVTRSAPLTAECIWADEDSMGTYQGTPPAL